MASIDVKTRRAGWSLWRWLPVPRNAQLLFAETLSQMVDADVEPSWALAVAARINPSLRFRGALRELLEHFRLGNSLAASLEMTRAWVDSRLVAALRVGQERGCLAAELSAYAHRGNPQIAARLARSLRRPPAAGRFAAVLSRLLTDHKLTVKLVGDAAAMVEGSYRFRRDVADVQEDMQAGNMFSKALAKRRRTFDLLFCTCVEASQERAHLRKVLARLGSTPH